MTRFNTRKASPASHPSSGSWCLQDAKAHFSELVRLAQSDGSQHVTLNGRDSVVVMAVAEYRRLSGQRTGQMLIDAIQASPRRDIQIEALGCAMPVRGISL